MICRYGVEYVLCWHGLSVYWAGVLPVAPEMQEYSPILMYAEATPGVLEVEPSMAWNPGKLAGVGVVSDPVKMYNNMHMYLKSSGVDGVKVDCQAGLALLGSSLGGGPSFTKRQVWRHFVERHFEDLINPKPLPNQVDLTIAPHVDVLTH